MRRTITTLLALATTACAGEEFEDNDIFGSGGNAGVAGQAGASGQAGQAGASGSSAGSAGQAGDAAADATCDDAARVVICSSEKSCPEGWHLSEWLGTPCGGSDTNWACAENCGETFVQCGAADAYPPCPEGWASLGLTHVEGCGLENPDTARVCGR